MRGAVPRGAGQHRSGSRQLALYARCRRSGASAGRIHRHAHYRALQQRQRGRDALVLSPTRGGGHQPREAAVVPAAGRGDARAIYRQRTPPLQVEAVAVKSACNAHDGRGVSLTDARRADHSPGREAAVCRRGRLDQEAARRTDPCGRGRRTDPRVPAPQRRVAGQQQVAGGPEGGRRAVGASLPDAHEPDRADRLDAAPRQGALHLLPRRGAARGGLALHRRSGAPSASTRTADGRAARPTWSTSPTRFR